MNTGLAIRFYSCQQAAKALGVTDGRIRQMLLAHRNIGTKHGPNWILTQSDVDNLRKLRNRD